MTRVLVLNSGSSSLKYQLIDTASGTRLAKGLVERIGAAGELTHTVGDGQPETVHGDLADHEAALRRVLEAFAEYGPDLEELQAVGHRIVHGGTRFTAPVIVDDAVEQAIEELVPLAPLHNPAGLVGLRALRRMRPDVPHVAVFDTAFHATIPEHASTYAIDPVLAAELGIRRYGFHGTSYQYVSRVAAQVLDVPLEDAELIVCHLGNGASVCAIRGGHSIDTSMGMTPLEGLVMGTRSGDLDPAIVLHLIRQGGFDADGVDELLNHRSGLSALGGASDVREVRRRAEDGDASAALALEIDIYRLCKYLGAYIALLPQLRAIVFTAGIGEHDPWLRAEVCRRLSHLGLTIDADLNTAAESGPRFLDRESRIRLLVVPTDEEAEIAAQTAEVVALSQEPPSHRGPSR